MTSLACQLARPELLELKPYTSGYDEDALASGVLLYANENPYAPSCAKSPSINRYPSAQPKALIARMREVYGVRPENIIATRGADEAIDLLVRSFCRPGEDAIAIAPPTFSVYAHAAKLQGARIIESPLDEDFTFNAERFLGDVDRETNLKLAFLCTPNNPTGGSIKPEELLTICDRLSKTIIVVDEAYIEFSDAQSAADLAPARDNLVVLRTLSKAYGIAGARCGCAIANKDIIDIMKRALPAYPLPSPTIEEALRVLSPVQGPIVKQNIARITEERERVRNRLSDSPFIEKIYSSSANFLFVRTKDTPALRKRLDQAGLRLRWFDNITPGAARVSIGAPQENNLLLEAFGVCSEVQKRRSGTVSRKTKETDIAVSIDLDRASPVKADTGLGFFDHMLEQVAQHGGFSLTLACDGDLDIDAHHTIEDCMLAFGEALREALGDRKGVARFGASLPMDETKAEALIDLSGRPFIKFNGTFTAPMIGDYPTQMTAHAFRSLADALRASIHISVEGENDHHKTEACFKAFGRALRQAVRIEGDAIPSTKGMLA